MSQEKGESGSCLTVQIVAPITDENPSGYILINESDFDPSKHDRYEPAADGEGRKGEGDAGHKKSGKHKPAADGEGRK